MKAKQLMDSVKHKLTADEMIQWNDLAGQGAPQEQIDDYAQRMYNKYTETVKRFRARNSDTQFIDYRALTTQEIFDWLKRQELGIVTYSVECIQDDIEIGNREFMAAFESGECPGDLQFF